jgi:S-adenosylmethionine:tRNA ribosyltransferase-isomerase
VDAGELDTDLLISPGYAWQVTDGLMTNFHLPRSTLIAMVAALFPEGAERVREIYAEAIRERYRFFSFGDAMLILP